MLRLVGSRYGVSISPTKVLANLFGTRADTLVTNDFAAARVVVENGIAARRLADPTRWSSIFYRGDVCIDCSGRRCVQALAV